MRGVGRRVAAHPAAPDRKGREMSAERPLLSLQGVTKRFGAVTIASVRSEVGTLSGGQRQQVAVARSLLGEPKVVLLDEPTAALGVAQTAQVLGLIKRLRERGLGVVVISHNLADVFEVADRIFVLRLGRMAGVFDAAKVSQEDVVAAITGARSAHQGGNGAGAPA